LDFRRWHRWQVVVGHEVAKLRDELESTGNAAAHLIQLTAHTRYHLIGVGREDERDVDGILVDRMMEDALAHQKPNRINYNEIVKAKIYTICDGTQRRWNHRGLLKLLENVTVKSNSKQLSIQLTVSST
jgi:hypothetical protein